MQTLIMGGSPTLIPMPSTKLRMWTRSDTFFLLIIFMWGVRINLRIIIWFNLAFWLFHTFTSSFQISNWQYSFLSKKYTFQIILHFCLQVWIGRYLILLICFYIKKNMSCLFSNLSIRSSQHLKVYGVNCQVRKTHTYLSINKHPSIM